MGCCALLGLGLGSSALGVPEMPSKSFCALLWGVKAYQASCASGVL